MTKKAHANDKPEKKQAEPAGQDKKVEPAAKAAETKPSMPKPAQKKPASNSSKPGLLSWVLIVLVAAAGWGILHTTGLVKDQQQQLGDIISQLAQAQQSLAQQRELQAQRNTIYESAIRDLKESLENLLQTNSHLRRDWLLAEAEYLIRLANHRLILMRDVETGIMALMAADQRLSEIGDPVLIQLRQELVNDIQRLRAVPKVDSVGISLTLNALASQINALPLRTPDPKTRAEQAGDSAASKTTSWDELPAAMWQDIKGLFTVRHHDQPVQKLLTTEQQFFVAQSVALKLEQARLAVMNGHAEIYKSRLQDIVVTIKEYYDINADTTQQVLQSLDELAQKNIQQVMPDISGSLKELDSYRVKADAPAITGNKPADKKAVSKKTDKPVEQKAVEKPAEKMNSEKPAPEAKPEEKPESKPVEPATTTDNKP